MILNKFHKLQIILAKVRKWNKSVLMYSVVSIQSYIGKLLQSPQTFANYVFSRDLYGCIALIYFY